MIRSRPGAALLAAALAAATPARAELREVDLVVSGGSVVTMERARPPIPDGAVAVDAGRIVAVGPAEAIAAEFRGRRLLAADGGIVLPGLVNAHTHAAMVLFRGIADDLKLMEWLQRYIFPAEARNVTAEFVRAGTRLAALEMLRSGTTTFVDMYYFEDQVAEAAREAGIRVVAGQTVIDFPAPDYETPQAALAGAERFLQRWTGDPLVVPALAPHSAYLLAPAPLRAVKALADRFAAPILVHVSETQDEQRQVRERFARTPTEQLHALGLLRKGLLAAHGVWLSAGDRELLGNAGAGVAHCPQSNMKLASGAAPVREMLAEGLRIGLGTDGAASNNDLDMFEEMLSAALLAKHASGDPTSAPAAAVLEMATLGGARALGLEDRIGSLEAGKRADLVVLSLAAERLHPLFDPVSHLVYAAKGADVRHVVVEGRLVVEDGQPRTLARDEVLAEAERWRARILESLKAPGAPR